MPTLALKSHETFAQARASGKDLMESYITAGFLGQRSSACRLNQRPDILNRISELQEHTAKKNTYDKTQAVRDLVAIVHARASDAAPDNPLCETRMGKDGPYHRFPSKLSAIARLIKLMDWHQPEPEAKPFAGPVEFYALSGLVPPSLREYLQGSPDRLTRYLKYSQDLRAKHAAQHAVQPVAQPVARHSDVETQAPSTPQSPPHHTTPAPSAPHPASSIEHPASSLTPRQEAFAQARFRGLSVMEAFLASDYPGTTPSLAWRLNRMPKIRARIAELNDKVTAGTGYRKVDVIHDLVQILHARPSEADPDHPLCEMRMSPWGPYHRFPSKLAALTLLIRLINPPAPRKPFTPSRS